MRMLRIVAAAGPFLFSGGPRAASACTTVAIGRKATADGSVIIAQADDGDVYADARTMYIPAMDHPDGAMRPLYYTDSMFPRYTSNDLGPDYKPNSQTGPALNTPIGYIPQVRHTFAYHDANFGIINEHNVAIDETTCSAVFKTCAKGDTRGCEPGRETGEALLSINMLSMIGLERATTAREAVQIMGDLAYKYGWYGSHDDNGDGEALLVADHTEAWIFHILADPTGAHAIWAAVRVPDDGVVPLANMFSIRGIDTSDTANCLASPNVYSVAEERGWWKPGEVLDFTRVYSNGEYANKYYAGRRMWRVLSLAAPSLNLSAEYDNLKYDRMWPWAVRPDAPITLEQVFGWYRDWYQGTEFDTTKGLAAGFGGTPDRFATDTPIPGAWERTIAIFRAQQVKIQHLLAPTSTRPKEVAGVAWISSGPPHYSPFLPVPSGLSQTLAPLYETDPKHMSSHSFNWQARKVMMIAQIRWDKMHPLVEAKQKEVEVSGAALLASATAAFIKSGDLAAFNARFDEHVGAALQTWQGLSDAMLFRYSDNSDIVKMRAWSAAGQSTAGVWHDGVWQPDGYGMTERDNKVLGYPEQWLKDVGFADSLPPPPPNDQCPPVCSAETHAKIPAASQRSMAASETRDFSLNVIGSVALSVAVVSFGAGWAAARSLPRGGRDALLREDRLRV